MTEADTKVPTARHTVRPCLRLSSQMAAAALSLLIWPASLSARTIHVTTFAAGSAWDGQCSLYEAVQAVNFQGSYYNCIGGDGNDDFIILSNPGTYHQSTALNINRDMRIEGTGKDGTTVSFDGAFDGFYAWQSQVPVSFTLAEVTVEGNGTAPKCVRSYGWGGIVDVTLLGVRVTGCTLAGVEVIYGGGLTIEHSEIVGNTGHGIDIGEAGFFMADSLVAFNNAQSGNGGGLRQLVGSNNVIYNTIFAHNNAARGGGLYVDNQDDDGGGYLQVNRSTIAYNSATIEGGGALQMVGGTPMTLAQSIVAENTAPAGPDTFGPLPSVTTLHGKLQGNTLPIATGHQNCICAQPPATTPARIGPLGNHGGIWDINSIPLLAGSYAFDRGTPTIDGPNNVDQRGLPRPQPVIPWQSSQAYDVGAVEMSPDEIQGLFQGEILPVAASSGDAHTIYNQAALSSGQAAYFQASATNDYVTYSINVPQAGTYEIRSAHRMANNRGIYRLYQSASASGSFNAIGGSIDFYSPVVELGERIHGTVTLPAGARYFRFLCTGKNANSSGYRLMLDYLTLIKQ